MTVAAPSDAALTAFEAAAAVYDDFTAHHDYEAWTDLIERLGRRHGLPAAGAMLDVGCGTGKSFLPWLDRGWAVTACDASAGMLEHARAKAAGRAELLLEDARDLPPLGRFDFVLVLDDVLNYLPAADLPRVFAGVAANLAPGGVLAFDLNTLRTLREFFGMTHATDTDAGVALWRGRTSDDLQPGEAAEAILDAFTEGPEPGTWRRHSGLHVEHHHPLATVEAALSEAGLAVDGVYGQDERGAVSEPADELRHTKFLVFARHARSTRDARREVTST